MRPAVAFPLLACLFAACVKIDGGAVEISWVIRTDQGKAITDCECADPAIATVRLVLQGVDAQSNPIPSATPCAGQAQCDFPCARQTGATGFDIPQLPGGEQYAISVVPVGTDGVELSKMQVDRPASILREVIRGQPTEVGSMQLVAGCATACGGMNSSEVCARP
ncbi:MAG TPA: hypothetical protein VKQ32_01650 [Polyangia bacterium]|nr:hypothetical protein [Polyangia bacterium]